MERREIRQLIDDLETLKRAARRAQLAPGAPFDDDAPCGWWVRGDE